MQSMGATVAVVVSRIVSLEAELNIMKATGMLRVRETIKNLSTRVGVMESWSTRHTTGVATGTSRGYLLEKSWTQEMLGCKDCFQKYR